MSWISLISKALFSCDLQQEKLGKQSIKEMPEHPHVPTRLGSKKARCNFHLENETTVNTMLQDSEASFGRTAHALSK